MKAEEVKEDIVYDKNTEYNYKQLCLIFGEKCCKSGKRTRQFERWRKKYNIIKIPNKNLYKISRITEKQRKKESIYSCFVSKEDKNKSGVYKIQLHNNIYIGQTNNFKEDIINIEIHLNLQHIQKKHMKNIN